MPPFDYLRRGGSGGFSMALCLAEGLIECGGLDPADQLERYCWWFMEGHLSGEPYPGPTGPHAAGNGSLMRLAPVPLFYAADPARAIVLSGESSRTTHWTRAAVDACRYFGGLLVGAVQGVSKEDLLADRFCPVPGVLGRPSPPLRDRCGRRRVTPREGAPDDPGER